ncbi:uncharacterized protein LOC127879746 [Dreissena polymorpha]|uniref:Uncharacterized protein n=1 Tax=Dreissena polymorpha TaxID=45954 RepID=A0A9D4KCE9_DREPO|nr:uncharacterized protein LOC127879746 [Dreissena polymorpha]XP_052282732.1 uncharacterized protein LOC127879746 [Dreissena polymorpha]XP_052282733.1 uncharacterized protein LOC127879746 [Dreissena polymorpha]XP_052282734.1 uncharacterized protein LOC127879746 [Dreissena polymorpha]KAH3837248.1 hypothetical protein DPMN_110629 [Dreissena polymorpha]
MTQSVSTNDVAALMALIDMIRLNWEEQPEMFRLLLAILMDYNPNIQGNKERTTRYLRLLISDQVTANCVLKSLPQGSPKRQCRPSILNHTVKEQHKNRFPLRTVRKSPVCLAPKNSQNKKPPASSSDTDQSESPLTTDSKSDTVTSHTAATPLVTESNKTSSVSCSSSDPKTTVTSTGLNPISSHSVSESEDQAAKKHTVNPMFNTGGYPFPYQPMYYPSMLTHIHSYAPMPSPSFQFPWAHMPYMHSFQDPSYQPGNSSQLLLDLSTKRTSSEVKRNGSSVQTLVRAVASNVGIAKPVKRSSSLSSLENVTNGQASKIAKTEACKANTSTHYTTVSNNMPHRVDKSVNLKSVGLKEGQTPYITLAGTTTQNNLHALKQLITNIRPQPVMATSSPLTIARAQSHTSSKIVPQSTQTCLATSSAQKTNAPTENTSASVKAETFRSVVEHETIASSKAFPYSQHIPLPDGRCPVANISVDHAVLGTFNQSVSITLQRQEAKPDVSGASQSVHVSDRNSKSIGNVTKASGQGTSHVQQYRTDGTCVTSSIVEMNRDPKMKQVKIKLDKHSSGSFLAELLKLKAGAPVSSPQNPDNCSVNQLESLGSGDTRKMETSKADNRAHASASYHRMLLPKSHVTARNLLANTSLPMQPKVPSTMIASFPVSSGQTSSSRVYSNVKQGSYATLPVRSYSLSDIGQDMPSHSVLKTNPRQYELASTSGRVNVPQFGSVASSNFISQHGSELKGDGYSNNPGARSSVSMSDASDRALLFALKERLQNVHRTLKESQLNCPDSNSFSDSNVEQKCALPKPKTPSLSSLHLHQSNMKPIEPCSKVQSDCNEHPSMSRSFSSSHVSDLYVSEGSGGSSVQVSPYLVGMLPDKMSGSDLENDDVFD